MENFSRTARPASEPMASPSGLERGVGSPFILGLVSCGGIGAILFTATYVIEGITRPGYDAGQQPISALSLGPGGWVQQANFILYGVLLVISAAGWYQLLRPARLAIWFLVLQSIGGLGLIGAGVFSMDPFPGYPPGVAESSATVHGTIHTILAYVLILALAESCFILALHFRRALRWRGWAAYSIASGVLMLVFWGAFVNDVFGYPPGLAERLSAGSHDLWMCLLVVTVLLRWRRAHPVSA